MILPDATVLASSLSKVTSPFLGHSADSSFRTHLIRTTLRLDAQPTMESVEAHHNYLLAEMEMLVASGVGGAKAKPTINALEGQSPPSPTSPTRGRSRHDMQILHEGFRVPQGD